MKVIRMRCDLCGEETAGEIPEYKMTYEHKGEEMGKLDLCEKCGQELIAHLRGKYEEGKNPLDRDFATNFYTGL